VLEPQESAVVEAITPVVEDCEAAPAAGRKIGWWALWGSNPRPADKTTCARGPGRRAPRAACSLASGFIEVAMWGGSML